MTIRTGPHTPPVVTLIRRSRHAGSRADRSWHGHVTPHPRPLPEGEGVWRQPAGAALIGMATHGRTGLSRAVFGSVAGQILEHGTTSLVLVRPPTPEHVAEDEKLEQRRVR
jgi:nucleotide-binding universal stress UspA family protein